VNRSSELKAALGYALDSILILVPTAGYLYLHATLGRTLDGYLPWIALVFVAIGIWRCVSHLVAYLDTRDDTARQTRPVPIASNPVGPPNRGGRKADWARRIRESNDASARVQAPLVRQLEEQERQRKAAADMEQRRAETMRQIRLLKR